MLRGINMKQLSRHCIAHNFEVVLYDSEWHYVDHEIKCSLTSLNVTENKSVGGIWSHVNSTSGLQINSLIYRFHPGVFWREGFPHRDEIVGGAWI